MLKSKLLKMLLVFFVLGTISSEAQIFKKKKTEKTAPGKPKKGAIQPYNKVITKKAKTDKGLFDVHRIDDNQFYEIPDSLFLSLIHI